MKKCFFLICCFLVFSFFGLARPVVIYSQIGLAPAHPNINQKESFSFFSFRLNPGEEKQGEVAVINLGEEEAEVALTIEGESSWLIIPSPLVSVKPQGRKNLQFSVQVPKEAKAGEHVFHLKAGEARIAVVVFVEGGLAKKEMEILAIKAFPQKDSLHVGLQAKNTGNLLIDSLSLKLKIKNKWGLGRVQEEFFWPITQKMLPGETLDINLQSAGRLPFLGDFTLNYELNYGAEIKKGPVASFSYFNFWRFSGFFLPFLLAVGLVLWFSRVLVLSLFKVINRFKKARSPKPWLWKKAEAEEDLELIIRRIVRQELKLFETEFFQK